jgi:hypothetical protein
MQMRTKQMQQGGNTMQQTVMAGEYATTLVIDSPTARPEPTEAEREAARLADRIPFGELKKRFGWDDSQWSFAEGMGFPKPIAYLWSGTVVRRREPVYLHSQVVPWVENLRRLAAGLPK